MGGACRVPHRSGDRREAGVEEHLGQGIGLLFAIVAALALPHLRLLTVRLALRSPFVTRSAIWRREALSSIDGLRVRPSETLAATAVEPLD